MVSKTETDQSITKKELLRAWAQDRLERHCEPNVTVTISALELAEATGEALDRFTLGYPCQVPLPEYGTTILERVTKLAWGDKLREPERVTVTLANQLNDVTNIIKQLSSSGGRNAGGGAKAQEEDHAWIVDTADHVGLVAEAIIGKDGETELILPEEPAAPPAYAVLREDITMGERVTGYTLRAYDREGNEIFSHNGKVISHKRILKIPAATARVKLDVTDSRDDPILLPLEICSEG